MDVIDFLEFLDDSDEEPEPQSPLQTIRVRKDPFAVYSDADFKLRYRFHKETVKELIRLLEPDLERPTKRSNSLSVEKQVLLTLRLLASGSFQREEGDIHGVSQPTVSRCIHSVIRAIASLKDRFIKFPEASEFQSLHEAFFRQKGFPGVVGAIDCTHVQIQNPGGEDPELYRNRKGKLTINVQLVSDNNLLVRNVVASWPGSTHDSRILSESTLKQKLQTLPREFHLLGDKGYGCYPYLLTPLKNPQPGKEQRYNYAQSSTRMAVERLNGVLKRRFAILHGEVRFNPEKTAMLIVACCVLHNIARMHSDDFEEADIDQEPDNEADYEPDVDDQNVQGAAKRRQVINDNF